MKKPLVIFTQLFSLVFWAVLGWLILTKCTGCASVPSAAGMPTPQDTNGHAVKFARDYAEQRPGSEILFGKGVSMQPFLTSGMAVVVAPAPYSTLRRGDPVVYRRKNGLLVCHVITGWCLRGYIVQGLNNEKWDAECVTPQNYIGVLVAAFK
jgi:hypothetical protein